MIDVILGSLADADRARLSPKQSRVASLIHWGCTGIRVIGYLTNISGKSEKGTDIVLADRCSHPNLSATAGGDPCRQKSRHDLQNACC